MIQPLIFALDAQLDAWNRNYEHVSSLWQYEGWLDEAEVQTALANYGGYSVRRTDGLRIITLNTDFCARSSVVSHTPSNVCIVRS